MKKILKYIPLLSLAALISCEGFVDGFEKDPNNPANESVDVNNMIQSVMLADAIVHEGELARLAGMWINQFTGIDRQYVSLNSYITTAGDYDSPWTNMYYGAITQARLAQQKADQELNPNLKGIAQILEAHAVGTATALFGDVPFTEAAQREMFATPKYDPQLQVYSGLQTLLDDAIKNLQLNKGIVVSEKDIYFGGDTQKWISVAYTLKARYYLHVRDYAQAEAAALQGIADPANDMLTPHGPIYGGNFNTYYSFMNYDRPGYMSAAGAYAPQVLDPELAGTFAPNRNHAKTDETARFNYLYLKDGDYDLNISDISEGYDTQGFFGAETSFPLVTFAENQLILAETQARQARPLEALTALNAHRANLNAVFSDTTNANPYQPYLITDFAPLGVENKGTLSIDNALLTEILEERYVTFIGQLESFNDVRRTDNALQIPAKGASGKIPERFLYPQNEVNTNPNIPKPLPGLFDPTEVNK